jgi:hypothetical protein
VHVVGAGRVATHARHSHVERLVHVSGIGSMLPRPRPIFVVGGKGRMRSAADFLLRRSYGRQSCLGLTTRFCSPSRRS